MSKRFSVSWLRHFLQLVDVLKLKLSNTRSFYDSTKWKLQVLHKHEIILVFFVLIWFSKFENQIKTKNTCVIYYLWRTCIFRLVEWKNKRVFDSLSFKTPTNVEKCHINEAKYFLNIFYTYQDFDFKLIQYENHFICMVVATKILYFFIDFWCLLWFQTIYSFLSERISLEHHNFHGFLIPTVKCF